MYHHVWCGGGKGYNTKEDITNQQHRQRTTRDTILVASNCLGSPIHIKKRPPACSLSFEMYRRSHPH